MLLVSDGERMLAGPEEAGDEPYLIAHRCPRAVVAVGSNRFELGRWVLDRFPVDCVLLDDGFQHLALHRDVNLLLVDATDVNGLDAVVPAGRLREPIAAAARATMIIITRADSPASVDQVIGRLRRATVSLPAAVQVVFRAEGLVSVTSAAQQPRQWSLGKAAMLCSGIGHAASFRTTAESLGLAVVGEMVYPDHHRYSRSDLDRLRAEAMALKADLIVTTEKDAGKLAALLNPADTGWWAVRLGTKVTEGEERLRQSILQPSSRTPVEVCA
jgi:tetraacyldisaccharide 4'-kinase